MEDQAIVVSPSIPLFLEVISTLPGLELNESVVESLDNGLLRLQGLGPVNLAPLKDFQYKRLQWLYDDYISPSIIKLIVQHFTDIIPDTVLITNQTITPLYQRQAIYVNSGKYYQIHSIPLKKYRDYKGIAYDAVAYHAIGKLRRNYSHLITSDFDVKFMFPNIPVVKCLDKAYLTLEILYYSLKRKGWIYIPPAFRLSLYSELAAEWDIKLKEYQRVLFGRWKQPQIRQLLEWLLETCVRVERGLLPKITVIPGNKIIRTNNPSRYGPHIKYLAIKSYLKLIVEHPILANYLSSIEVNFDNSITVALASFKQQKKFEKYLQNDNLLYKNNYVNYTTRMVASLEEGVIYRFHLLRNKIKSVLVDYQGSIYLVSEKYFDFTLDKPDKYTNEFCDTETENDISEQLRAQVLKYYYFCKPHLESDLTLSELMLIVPIPQDPQTALCLPQDQVANKIGTVQNFIVKYLLVNLEYGWRGYYSFAGLEGLLPFIPAVFPVKINRKLQLTFWLIERSNISSKEYTHYMVDVETDTFTRELISLTIPARDISSVKELVTNIWNRGLFLDDWNQWYYYTHQIFSVTLNGRKFGSVEQTLIDEDIKMIEKMKKIYSLI